ncbi:MAG: PAS domain S-box protein [Burkholderiales bacterium]|nr:PAS domain S-box protein [Anaerolineae bacterium]
MQSDQVPSAEHNTDLSQEPPSSPVPYPSSSTHQTSRWLVREAGTVIIALTPDYRVIEWSGGAELVFGWKQADILGKNYLETCIPVEHRAAIAADIAKVLAGIPTRNYENPVRTWDGQERTLVWNINRLLDEDGSAIGIIAVGFDITERKQSEAQLRLMKAALTDNIDAVLIIDVTAMQTDGPRVTFVNEAFAKVTGYSLEDINALGLGVLDGPKTEASIFERLKTVYTTGEAVRVEIVNYRKDGAEFWVQSHVSPIIDDSGQVTHVVSFRRDITERKQSEEALRATEERFALATEAGGVGVWDWDMVTDAMYLPSNLKSLLGYEMGEIEPTLSGWIRLLHPGDRARVQKELENALESDIKEYLSQQRMIHKNGEIHSFMSRSKMIRGVHDQPVRMVGSITDVTVMVNTLSELRETEEQNRLTLAALAEGVILQDAAGRILTCNASAERIFGLTSQQLVGQIISDLPFHMVQADGSLLPHHEFPAMLALNSGQPQSNAVFGMSRPDGAFIWIAANAQPIFHPGEETPYQVVLSFTDITERKRAESQQLELAVERERVSFLQRFIRDASHDLYNPLSVIQTSLYLLRRSLDDANRRQTQLDKLEDQVKHLQELLENLLHMSRLDAANIDEFNFEYLNIHQLISDVINEQQNLIQQKEHTVTFNAGQNIPPIMADHDQLKRAVRHLLVNAINYTEDGGQITLQTYAQDSYVTIEVQDNGIGINPEDLEHIFERFFRADRARNIDEGGMGLGLTIARRIAEAHKGRLEVSSVPGIGSTFKLHLPYRST